MRVPIQIASLSLFTLLFIAATYKVPDWLPADLYLRLDPLVAISAILANREFIPRVLWALLWIGITIIVGRFFCGYICPLGASVDFLDPVFFRRKKRWGVPHPGIFRKVKYFALVVFVSAALVGVSLAYLLDPIPLITRTYTFFLYPMVITFFNLAMDLFRPLFKAFGWMGLSHFHSPQPFFYMSFITFLIFAGVIALSRLVPRFWCRYLCPLGALLSLISPLGLWKRRVSEKCNRCGRCQKECPMEAIEEDPRQTRLPECIQCRTCQEVCPKDAIRFRAASPAEAPASIGGEYSSVDLSRRELLYSFGGGVASALLIDRTPFTPLHGKHQLIRPPGAIPEAEFLRICVRCGQCMKSCLTNTLQPCFWETGFTGLWTPQMDLRFAGCEQNCNACGKVCPTQAIRSLSLEEKNYAKVGTAVLLKEKCLVWAQDKLCLVCDEICPYNAIVFRTIDGYRRPVVIASRCNGCGYCEQKCPVQGDSAIVVVPQGEIRLREGSYVKEAQRLQLEFKADPGDDKYILDQSGFKVGDRSPEQPKGFLPGPPSPGQTPKPQKPKGFL